MLSNVKNVAYSDLLKAAKDRDDLGTHESALARLHRLESVSPPNDIDAYRAEILRSRINAAVLNGSWSVNRSILIDDAISEVVLNFGDLGFPSITNTVSSATSASIKESMIVPFLIKALPWFHVHFAIIRALNKGKAIVFLRFDDTGRLLPFICERDSLSSFEYGVALFPNANGTIVNYINPTFNHSESFDLAWYDLMLHLATFGPGMEARAELHVDLHKLGPMLGEFTLARDDRGSTVLATISRHTYKGSANVFKRMGDDFGWDHNLLKLDDSQIMNGDTPLTAESGLLYQRVSALKNAVLHLRDISDFFSGGIKDHVITDPEFATHDTYPYNLLTCNGLSWDF